MTSSTMSLEEKLKRIIYINSSETRFYVGNPDEYQKDQTEDRRQTIDDAIQNDLTELFAVIDAANTDKNLPRRSILFLVLGKLLDWKNMTPELKHKVTTKVLQICQSDQDFFDFIKYYTQLRLNKSKMPSSVEKAVRKFYLKKSPLELAQSCAKFNSYNKWSHKDLIKLAHVKSDTPLKNVVINYILKDKTNDKESDEAKKILDIIKKSNELRSTNEAVNAIPIISDLKLTISQVSSTLHQNGEVWAAALENMTIQEILPCLGKLYKLGLLKPNTTIHNYLIDLFTDSDKVKASGVHPIEVFTFMKRLEKGGKPMDGKLVEHLKKDKKMTEEDLKKAKTRNEAKCPNILNALQKCFTLACNNVLLTNKRYVVTIDVTEKAKNALCLGNKVLTFTEAAVAYALVLIKVEKDVVVATHNDDKINIIHVEKKISYSELFEKVNSCKASYSLFLSPIEWAASEKKHVDVFINFAHQEVMCLVPKDKKEKNLEQPLVKYRKKVNLPNAKLVTFCVSGHRLTISHVFEKNNPPNAIDILGFDSTACKAVECFCKGTFS